MGVPKGGLEQRNRDFLNRNQSAAISATAQTAWRTAATRNGDGLHPAAPWPTDLRGTSIHVYQRWARRWSSHGRVTAAYMSINLI